MKTVSLILTAIMLFITMSTECRLQKTFQIPDSTVIIIIEQSDITKSKVDIIVNAANEQLAGGDGVCGAIFNAAGWEKLQYACNKHPASNTVRCPVGEARITDSFNLKKTGIKYIIHAVGPDCRIIKNPRQQNILLQSAYQSSLKLAQEVNAKSIAFPFISSAIYACPKQQAANIALKTIYEYCKNHQETTLTSIHFVLFSSEDFNLFCQAIDKTSRTTSPSILQKVIQYLKSYFAY